MAVESRSGATEPVSAEDTAARGTDPISRAPASPPPRVGWRWPSRVMLAGLINLAVGIWLIVSPELLDFGTEDPRWIPTITGAGIAAIAAARIFAVRAAWLGALDMLLGAWLVAAGLFILETTAARWNTALMGGIVFVVALLGTAASAEGTTDEQRPTTF